MIFGPTRKSERQDEETAATLIDVTEALGIESIRRRFFLRFALANLVVWVLVGAFAGWLYYLFTEVFSLTDTPGLIAVLVPFVIGFYGAYSFLRIRMPNVEDNKHLESEMLSTYHYNADSTKRWFVWVGAVTFGLLNAFGIIVFVYVLGG
ncbi:MAG: hypothetical protein ABL984_15285 [Pyrinomonadaceae bacterium]